ncbi:S-adenosyl-L-methionine-dependent methyltransferase [Hypoxylon fuscum]|nr:S-adenosyl-L-methionine-dependent methyltransferase [Hypoxylon fuscum]
MRHFTSWTSIHEDEWEEEEQSADKEQAAIERRFQEMPSHASLVTIDLSNSLPDENEEHENEVKLEPGIARVIEVIDLTAERTQRRPRQVGRAPKRNPSIAPPSERMDSYTYNGMELRCGITVEMTPIPELHMASFLLVQLIFRTGYGIILRGLPMTRTKNLRGQLQRLRNEVALVLRIDQDDLRPDEEQAAIEIPIDRVQKIRTCHITNKNFPEHRFPNGIYKDVEDIEERGVLVCRWKRLSIWRDAEKRVRGSPCSEFVIAHITAGEVRKDRLRATDSCLMNNWRGGKVRGGSFVPGEPEARLMVNVEDDGVQDGVSRDIWTVRKPGQQYTLADMFCGAGGASCGVRSAGFRIKLSCDNAEGACRTYRLNFPEVDLRQQDMYDLIMEMRASRSHIDVLHLSPPCQYWSPAHTTPGVGDEANIAILFSCHELIKSLRPRIFTLEQTFGILHPKFEYYFNALVHGFTQHNYSVRWKVVNLLSWGAPSQRQRLIMIGACPGEELPPYPVATHSSDPIPGDGTKPYRTVRQMLRKIPRGVVDDLHEPQRMKRIRKPSWDPDVPLARTITCSGGVGNFHYRGRRCFTLREYATLQGFPVDYQFQRPEQKRQIGNAFPPLVVQALYKHLRMWLEQKDRIHAGEDEDEVSESENDENYGGSDHGSEVDKDSDVEFIEQREIDSEIQYLGGRNIRSHASVVTIDDSASDDGMDIDAMSQDVYSPGVYLDTAQLKGNDPSGPIELD